MGQVAPLLEMVKNADPHASGCGCGTCGVGQSPVNILTSKVQPLPEGKEVELLFVNCEPSSKLVAYSSDAANSSGKTDVAARILSSNNDKGAVLTIGREMYWQQPNHELIHFHKPSEHAVDGRISDLEAHLKFESAEGKLAVVAVRFKEGAHNPDLQYLLDELPKDQRFGQQKHWLQEKAEEVIHEVGAFLQSVVGGIFHRNLTEPVEHGGFNPLGLMPKGEHPDFFYNEEGSLTTPPYTSGVQWIVFREEVEASKAQIAEMHALMKFQNTARQVQPVGEGQTIYAGKMRGLSVREADITLAQTFGAQEMAQRVHEATHPQFARN